LNEKLKPTGFQIGLNDRLAFVNHLFENNNEDYDRVMSQLSTMDSFEEISDFYRKHNKTRLQQLDWEGRVRNAFFRHYREQVHELIKYNNSEALC